MANPYKKQQKQSKADDLKAQCQALVSAGKRVEAVKLYRQITGADLRRAMAELQLKHW